MFVHNIFIFQKVESTFSQHFYNGWVRVKCITNTLTPGAIWWKFDM